MATADIAKQAIFDARIVQNAPRYAVQKGGLSLTNAPFNAISATASQHTYQINVPSQNVFVDRAIEWSAGVDIQFNVIVTAAAPADGSPNQVPIAVWGRDLALCAFPLNSLIATTTCTINDTSVTMNTDSVLWEVLRLADYRKNRLSRTCPTMLDTLKSYEPAAQAIVSPISDYLSQSAPDQRPNGAWYDIEWIDPNDGAVLSGGTTAAPGTYVFSNGAANVTVRFARGIPVLNNAGAQGGNPVAGYPLAVRFRSTEKLVLSPFIFADAAEWETGIFGVNNMQLVLSMKADISRVLRCCPTAAQRDVPAASIKYRVGATSPFRDPRVNVQVLTPSLDLPLPAKSVVQYLEYPRYLQSIQQSIPAGGTLSSQQSQTIVLPQIPDMLLIYCKPNPADLTPSQGDWYLPIKKISVNFDNFAGLLSSHTKEQLYAMSVHNGLDMDYDQWSGLAMSGKLGATDIAAGGAERAPYRVQTVGGFLVLRMGVDITLQAGQAPGLIGNYTLQYQVDIENPSDAAVVNPILYTIAVNSGFFETMAGSSRIVKGVLSESDIISAEPAPEVTHEGLERLVGHGFMDKLGSFLTKAKDVYAATKPALSAVKGMLPEEGMLGKVKSGMSAVGYGRAGGGAAGGAGVAGGRKTLSARLM
jgi:hypothetical protein